MKILTLLSLSLLFVGCETPTNRSKFQLPDGSVWTLANPKDTAVKDIEFRSGTNYLKIGSIVSTNSPQVIDKVSAGNVEILKQVNQLIGTIAEKVK